ncbi:MAG: tetratricopeptide repeat protein [Acidobacteriia bacterium]|nr:tetratricopeptide repeat protein [Terriglobia bacterium]
MPRNLLICALLLAAAPSLGARQIDPSKAPPPPPPEAPAAQPANSGATTPPPAAPAAQPMDPSTPPPPPSTDAPDAFADPSEPVFDPLHAERSMDVGTYYLKTGKIDAAIDRFLEAAHYEPSLAKPWRALGEAYEKKGASASAVEAYKKYLEILPTAEDARKIQKRISALEEKTGKESTKAAAH